MEKIEGIVFLIPATWLFVTMTTQKLVKNMLKVGIPQTVESNRSVGNLDSLCRCIECVG